LYAKYADINNLITADELSEFRKKYDLSQREFTSIIDLGKMTINRYENGSLPTKSNSEFLKIIMSSEETFLSQLEKAYASGRISQKTHLKIKDKLEINASSNMLQKYVKSILTQEPSEFNGFKKFDFDKTECLIAYLAMEVPLTITNVNKYLWYIDFVYFKEYMTSLTGLSYVKEKYGPVVYNRAYEELIKVNPFISTYEEENGDFRKKCIINIKEPNLSVFSEKELSVIEVVIRSFKNMNVGQMSNESHKEKGWMETAEHQKISYAYALELNNF